MEIAIGQRALKVGMTCGVSVMAMTLFAGEAQAQATPGSPQCPIVNRIVTCSGNLPDGVRVPAGADRDGLTVENLTADIALDLPAASVRPAIEFTAGTATSTIRIVDSDNRLSVTSTAPAAMAQNQLDLSTSAVLLTATNNSNFSLLSDIDIVTRASCSFGDCVRRREIVPNGITVRGSLGNFAIDNRGDISVAVDQSQANANAISVDVFGADLVTIRNSGSLTGVNAGGIFAPLGNRRIEITNDGSISVQDNRETSTGGISLLQAGDSYADGFTRPFLPEQLEFTYRIVNNGSIQVVNEAAIRHSSIYTIAGGFIRDAVGTGEIINNGTIVAPLRGILLFHSGEATITNNGRIESNNAMFVVGGKGTARIFNTASGVIVTGEGIIVDGGIAEVSNAGLIEASGDSPRGIDIRTAIATLDSATISNSGQIVASGEDARAVRVSGNDGPSIVTNSGTITATGNNAVALSFINETFEDDMPEALIGTVDVDLAASSVVRGGSGTGGAGILFFGGERNAVRNAGLITSGSGRAIVGGSGVETIDNSGRIEGSVTLAAGNDAVTMRAGAVQIGTLDGGTGTDTLLFDILSGEASATGAILNFESVTKSGAGTLTLRDTGTIGPTLSLLGGTLLAEGNLGATAISASTGTVLGGSGSVGAVTIANGATLSPGGAGSGVGTLTMSSLALSGASRLQFNLGAPGQVGGADNDLIIVTGNLTLDGLLDINARAAFGMGVYRLINYGGALTDNGLVIGTAPAASYEVQTSVAGQVNLVVGAVDDLSIQFWDDGDTSPDGVVDGGAGTWSTGRTNWTNLGGTANNAWAGNFAVFQNSGGTVTVEGQQGVTGMQFMANGYRLVAGTGGSVSLNAAETVVRVDPNVTAELALPLIGTGTLVKRDLGTLLLSGANTYSGGTVIREGALRAASDSALGAAAGGVMLDGGVLRFDAAGSSGRAFTIGAGGGTVDTPNAFTLAGSIGGGGAFTKAGAGTLTLSGNSSAFAGSTSVSAGLLNITGSLGGSLTVQNGGRLGGTGTLGNLTIASGGILAPGTSPGTLTATGNVIFRGGSFYDLEIGAAGGRDLLAASGTATIEGGTVRVTALDPETQYVDGTRYTFLTAAGGLTGTFTGLTETSAFLDFILGYDATSAFVTVDVIRTFPDVAQTFNQQQASTALMTFNNGGTDALAVYNQLLLLDAAPARASFDLASGEIYAVTLAAGLRRADGEARRLLSHAQGGSGEGWGLWGSLSGDAGEVEGDGNGAGFDHDSLRGALGLDYRGAANRWAVGLGGGLWKGDISLSSRVSRAEAEGWHLGGYARFGTGGGGFTATLSGAYLQGEAEVARAIVAGPLTRAANARVDVDSWSLAGELRYGFDLGNGFAAGPLARASVAQGSLGQFTESGAGSLGLTGSASNEDSRTRYGGGVFGRWAGASGSFDLSVAYVTGDDDPTEVGLIMAGSSLPFRVRAARGEAEGAEASLSGRIDLGSGWSVGGGIGAFLGQDDRQLRGSATIGWRF